MYCSSYDDNNIVVASLRTSTWTPRGNKSRQKLLVSLSPARQSPVLHSDWAASQKVRKSASAIPIVALGTNHKLRQILMTTPSSLSQYIRPQVVWLLGCRTILWRQLRACCVHVCACSTTWRLRGAYNLSSSTCDIRSV